MADNKALQRAAKAQQDEFYTSMDDITEELRHYWPHFEGSKILCNCDDPYESKFFRYFAINFNVLKLAKLTATCYAGSPIAQRQLTLFDETLPPSQRKPYCAEITDLQDYNHDTATDYADIEYMLTRNVGARVRVLEGDGDFRSPECLELLRDADVVVTNPPFSLFREYVALLMKYNKKFLIIGNKNAVTYKEIFPLLMQNKMWVGFRNMNRDFWLTVLRDEGYEKIASDGRKVKHIMACWFTNLPIKKRHGFMILWRSYAQNPELYPRYDNYDAIEVSKTQDIPADYDGVMGVPITFLDKYNPEQFEILGLDRYIENNPHPGRRFTINGKEIYARILIRKISERVKTHSIIHHGAP